MNVHTPDQRKTRYAFILLMCQLFLCHKQDSLIICFYEPSDFCTNYKTIFENMRCQLI